MVITPRQSAAQCRRTPTCFLGSFGERREGSEDPRGPPRELLGVSLISTAERERPRETPIPHLGGASLGH